MWTSSRLDIIAAKKFITLQYNWKSRSSGRLKLKSKTKIPNDFLVRGLKKPRAYIGKTKNRKLAANERKISTLISNDLLAKHYYSRTRKLGKEEGAAAMRANQSITRSRGAELMEPCCATNSWARQGWTGGCWLGLYEASTGTKTKLRRSSEKRQRHCSYEAMKGKVRLLQRIGIPL
jgi:hypothetical protein